MVLSSNDNHMSLLDGFNFASLPWPDGTKKLFQSGHPSPFVATIAPSWARYAIGYRLAAEELVQHIRDTRMMADLLIYPVIYLYRHYTELRLKELIREGNRTLGAEGALVKPSGHNLKCLWRRVRPIIERLSPEPDQIVVERVENLILELHDHDPCSTEARYPDSFKTTGDVEFIDIINLHEAMQQLAAFLDGASDMMSAYSSADG
jgi:hypothetical protein